MTGWLYASGIFYLIGVFVWTWKTERQLDRIEKLLTRKDGTE